MISSALKFIPDKQGMNHNWLQMIFCKNSSVLDNYSYYHLQPPQNLSFGIFYFDFLAEK